MITKKEWDALPLTAKKQILAIAYGEDFERFPPKKLLYEYRHNFDFDETGKRLKKLLKMLYKTDDYTINVRVDVSVSKIEKTCFLLTPTPQKPPRVSTNKIAPVKTKRWRCDYTPTYCHEDLCHVWCEAESREEARSYFQSEYHDIYEIIQICEMK